jgi:hypothetical protein
MPLELALYPTSWRAQHETTPTTDQWIESCDRFTRQQTIVAAPASTWGADLTDKRRVAVGRGALGFSPGVLGSRVGQRIKEHMAPAFQNEPK